MEESMNRIFLILTFTVCAFCMKAQRETYRLNVGQFDKLLISDDVNVVYRSIPDSTGFAVFEGEREFADAFIFTNSKGKLKIQVNTDDVDKPGLPTVTVYSDFLTWVESSSSYVVTIHNSVSVPTFSAYLEGNGKIIADNIKTNEAAGVLATGNGSIILSGTASKGSFRMVGAGTIKTDELECEDVKCRILGTGKITCWGKNTLDVRGIGSTKIYYKGTPDIKKVGGGKVFPLSEYSLK